MFLRCLFCKRERRLFKISMVYGRTGCPIKDYIVEILGPCEEHLCDEHGICSLCVYFLNNLLYIKKCMSLIISVGGEENCNKPFLKFSHVYKHFMENLQTLNYEEGESDEGFPELLRPGHSSPFDEEHEAQSAYNRYATPYADQEVQNVFSGRRGRRGSRKRRGHNWTRRKGSRPKSNLTVNSEPILRRSWRHMPTANFSEYQDSGSDDDNDEEIASTLHNVENPPNGILTNKRRRSLDEQQDEISIEIAKKYKCISSCSFEFDNLDKLTDHKKETHGMLAKYVCYECCASKTFVSPEDLKLHDDLNHSVLISNCSKCSMELRTKEDLRNHLREPHSYSCSYCDMLFVSQGNCEIHVQEYHEGKKKIIKRFKEYTIVDRAYKRNDTPINGQNIDSTYNGQIIWRLQKSVFVEKLSTLCLNVIIGFKPGAVDIATLLKTSYDTITLSAEDNYRKVNIPDYTNENYLMQNDINSVSNSITDINNSDIPDACSDILFETSEVVPNIAKEMNVYTSKNVEVIEAKRDETGTWNDRTDPEPFILTTNESFEKFITKIDVDGSSSRNGNLANVNLELSQGKQISNTQGSLANSTIHNSNYNSRNEEL